MSIIETPVGAINQKRDETLIKATLQGDMKSFATLMGLYKQRIASLGMSFFKNTTDTEDFVQEVFIRVYTHLSSFQGNASFSTWITRIAYNMAISAVNRRKEYLPIADENALIDPGFTPEEKELRRITMQAVREAVKELPERYAVCLDMYFFYDMSYQDISDPIDLPINTVKSHIFRAKKILKDTLEGVQL